MATTPSVFWVAALFVCGFHGHTSVYAEHQIVRNDLSTKGNLTRLISENEPNAELFSVLIGILEKLDILSTKSVLCHVLQKVVRQVSTWDQADNSREIAVTLYFQEKTLNQSQVLPIVKNRQAKNIKAVSECKNDGILMSDAHPLLQDREMNNSSMNNGTGASVLHSDNKETHETNIEGLFGLSHTQVVVISTCSAIIGTFFLVAAIMRIRNYVKRIRAEQDLQRRQTFRSCSFTLANNNSPSQDSDRSKASPKGSYTIRMPKTNSLGKISSNGSRTLSDTKPLLTVNPVPQPPLPPTTTLPSKLSNTSLQFIDEDTNKLERVPDKAETIKLEQQLVESQPMIEKPTLKKNDSTKSFTLETTRGWTFDQDITEAGRQGLIHANFSFDDPQKALICVNSINKSFDNYDNNYERLTSLTKSGEATLISDTKVLTMNNISPIIEEVLTPETVEYSNFGLTQSDESLSTSGSSPFYSYGNQTEYINTNSASINHDREQQNIMETSSSFPEHISKAPLKDVVSSENLKAAKNSSGVVCDVDNDKHSNENISNLVISSNEATGAEISSESVSNKKGNAQTTLYPIDVADTSSNPTQAPKHPKHKHSLQRLLSFDEDEKTTVL